MFLEVDMKFENQEVIDRVVLELHKTVNFNSMTTSQHRCFLNYLRLVDKCYTLESSRYSEGVRGAKHHILPKSMYPEFEYKEVGATYNWNVVLMTHKEHFVAHHLLFEIYSRSGPMALSFRLSLSGLVSREFCKKSNLDQVASWSHKQSKETTEKIANSNRGKKRSDSARRNMSEAAKGKVLSESHRSKIRESLKGREGKTHSEETKKKIGDASRGRNSYSLTCPHCGKLGKVLCMKRWHFDNCKKKPS